MQMALSREADSNFVYLWVYESQAGVELVNAVPPDETGSGDTDEEYAGSSPNIVVGPYDDSSPRVCQILAAAAI